MKRILFTAIIAGTGVAAGWFLARHSPTGEPMPAAEKKTSERKVLFYQSSMHPWIKSDKPGNCTICGMKLTPVYEGEQAREVEGNVVQLSTNSVTVLNVQTAEVVKRPLKRTIRAAGIIEDDDTRHRIISAYVAGRIDELHVNYVGAEVTKGT